jgi:uncharacterized protein (TIGR02246 family)
MGEDERAIREFIRSWFEASAGGDVDRVLSLMSDDVVVLTPGQKPFGKEAFAASSRAQAGAVRFEARSEVQEVAVTGDVAHTRTRLEVSVSPVAGGEPKRLSGHTLSVFRKQPDGRWLLTRDANLLSPEPPRPGVRAAVPVFQVASVARSIDWYREVLGLAADPFGEPVSAILRRDDVELMVQKAQSQSPARPALSGLGMDAYLRVRDVESLHATVRAKTADLGPVVTREYGCREFTVTDPDGHVLVFGE